MGVNKYKGAIYNCTDSHVKAEDKTNEEEDSDCRINNVIKLKMIKSDCSQILSLMTMERQDKSKIVIQEANYIT